MVPDAQSGTYLSPAQIYLLALQAGFNAHDATVMTAVAMAESSGNTHAYNPSGAAGIWQIMPFNQHGGNAMDPVQNAKMAFNVYKSQGLRAWEAYTNGSYQKYTNQALQAAAAGGEGALPPALISNSVGLGILNTAYGFIGTPYVWGGSSPAGFDCSGLVQYVYSKYGVNLPRTTYDQVHSGTQVSDGNAMPGDLVFYGDPGAPHHVGIYLGNGMMLDAPHTGAKVQVESVWNEQHTFRRVLNAQQLQGVPKVFTQGDISQTPSLMGASLGGMQIGQAFLANEPEIAQLINKAASEGWDDNKVVAGLMNTNWWKTHSQAQRQWENLKTMDPATSQSVLSTAAGDALRLSAQLGAHLDAQSAKNVAQFVLALSYNGSGGYDSSLMLRVIANSVTPDKSGNWQGQAGTENMALNQMAANYGVPMTKSGMDWLTYTTMRGSEGDTGTEKGLETTAQEWFKQQAKSMFPGLSKQLDTGMTTADVAMPYVTMLTKELELGDMGSAGSQGANPAASYLNDPLVKQALQYKPPPGSAGSGASSTAQDPQLMPLYQFEQMVRQDPRWLKTNNARDSLTSGALQVLQDMGLTNVNANPPVVTGG